jgi:hypothetical protein
MGKRAAGLAHYALMVVLFPVTLVGFVIWVGKLLIARTPGVSTTAQGPLSARWTMHVLGVREDEAANRMLPMMPGVPWLGMRLASWPMVFAHRVTGFVPKTYRYPFEDDVTPSVEAAGCTGEERRLTAARAQHVGRMLGGGQVRTTAR